MIEKMKPRQMGAVWDIDLEEVATLCLWADKFKVSRNDG